MRPPLQFSSGHRWDWARPYVLGVLNVTPDSFSDGGVHATLEAALGRAAAMLDEGADAIDVGGQSTRPGAATVDEGVELERVVPVVRGLAARGVLVSVDTTRAVIARAALDAGAAVLNDVGTGDTAADLAREAVRSGAVHIRMHSRGDPTTMHEHARYGGVVTEVVAELLADVSKMTAVGLDRARIVLDPGIGFAKRAHHSIALLAGIRTLRGAGYPVCVGPSRKSFIDAAGAYDAAWRFVDRGPDARVGGTAAAVTAAVLAGAEIVRVHDVAVMAQAARVAHAILRAHGDASAGS